MDGSFKYSSYDFYQLNKIHGAANGQFFSLVFSFIASKEEYAYNAETAASKKENSVHLSS